MAFVSLLKILFPFVYLGFLNHSGDYFDKKYEQNSYSPDCESIIHMT